MVTRVRGGRVGRLRRRAGLLMVGVCVVGSAVLGPVTAAADADGQAVGWSAVSAGGQHVCGLASDGSLWCWGRNNDGQNGTGNQQDRHVPTQVGSDTDWAQLSVGYAHTCAIKSDASLWCWGSGRLGRLGLGDKDDRSTPSQVGGGDVWAQVSAGVKHTCGVQVDHTLWCWGQGVFGALGTGRYGNVDTPRQVAGADWEQVTTGRIHTCAIKTDQSLWCWGDNGSGELGQGHYDRGTAVPVRVVGEQQQWAQVTAGYFTTMAIAADGALWGWGANNHGQLGLGKHSDAGYTSPQQVGKLTSWQTVHTGILSSCGTHTAGSPRQAAGSGAPGGLWCWGDGKYGTVGTGDTTDRFSPTRVDAATDWVASSTGRSVSTGIRTDGSAWCWGENHFGQLGLGDTKERLTPTKIPAPGPTQ